MRHKARKALRNRVSEFFREGHERSCGNESAITVYFKVGETIIGQAFKLTISGKDPEVLKVPAVVLPKGTSTTRGIIHGGQHFDLHLYLTRLGSRISIYENCKLLSFASLDTIDNTILMEEVEIKADLSNGHYKDFRRGRS